MPFLRINGWTVPVANAKSSRKIEAQSKRGRSFRGQMRDTRRLSRLSWDIECAFQTFDDAQTLQHLVMGRGHVFGLGDGLQASTSLLPESYDPSLLIDQFGADSFGNAGRATFGSSVLGAVFVVDAQLDDDWTVHARVFDATLARWVPRAWRSDGAVFVDGERDDAAGRPFALGGYRMRVEVMAGVMLVVKDATGAVLSIDDLIVLPFRASDSFIAAISQTFDDVPEFGRLPQLAVDGTIFADEPVPCIVQGEIGDADIVEGGDVKTDQGWIPNARVVRFTLTQVLPQFVLAT